jgi:hypothetical protein
MKNFITLLLLVSISFILYAKDPVELKLIPLNDFMQNLVEGTYPISIPVPVEYEAVLDDSSLEEYSYWMRKKDVKKAKRTGDLPVRKGFMFGKISLNVGYDSKEDIFINAEEPHNKSKFTSYFDDVHYERLRVGVHEILLIKFTDKKSKARAYTMYIATNIATNVIYIAYRPAKNSKNIGDFYWKKLMTEIKTSNKVIMNSASPN